MNETTRPLSKDTRKNRRLGAANRDARKAPKEPVLTQIASFVELFVWLLVLKSFFLPLFIIPTGSMAETLAGAHATFTCPNCGTTVRADAKACPECGSDEQTGWGAAAEEWSPDIPGGHGGDDEFDYDAYVRREFGGGGRSILGMPAKTFALLVVSLALAALLLWALR